ncbi:MAG TPA: hypothetical protein VFV50_17335 [Bdellovibrionales bacterium]|nr:hypothetical protein [Bdellovibrionales bacterium]
MKAILFALSFMLAAPAAQADFFYECFCKTCGGSERFEPDVLADGRVVAIYANDDYEVADTARYKLDLTYNPSVRRGYYRYLPTSTGGNYMSHPVAIVPINFHKGVLEGTVYLQHRRENGSIDERTYKCKRRKDRNVDAIDQ